MYMSLSNKLLHIMPSSANASTSTLCDTLPAARLTKDTDTMASYAKDQLEPSVLPAVVLDDSRSLVIKDSLRKPSESSPQPAARKLCVRHQRMADEGTNLKLQHVRTRVVSFIHSPNKSQ